jgi:adenylate kinase family enzyme
LALAQKCEARVVHLDQLRFEPQSDWVLRDRAKFEALHRAAIDQDFWVMEGNYASHLSERLERATGVIVLDAPVWLCLVRYLRRTIWRPSERVGGIGHKRDRVTWEMLKWVARDGRSSYADTDILKKTALPLIVCKNTQDVRTLYSTWGLSRG